jgi:hypothetical protein
MTLPVVQHRFGLWNGASSRSLRRDWPEGTPGRFDEGNIEIQAAKVKTASRRLVPITDNLVKWLTPHVQKTAVEQQRSKDTKADKQGKPRGLASSKAFTRQVKPNKPSFPAPDRVFVSSLLGCSFLN